MHQLAEQPFKTKITVNDSKSGVHPGIFREGKAGNDKIWKEITSVLRTVQEILRKCNVESIISSVEEKTESADNCLLRYGL